MRRKRSKRYLRKYLRRREKVLGKHLSLFLDGFDAERPLDDESNFHLLLKLRWLIYDFIYVRLKLNPRWMRKKWFLELFDVDSVRVKNGGVEFSGDIVWWAEGKDAEGEWWPADHEPHRTGVYKVKIRGDMDGGDWVVEPVTAKLRKSKLPKRNAGYEIDFGKGSTYMKINSR
jgi:hypothetical protein